MALYVVLVMAGALNGWPSGGEGGLASVETVSGVQR